METTINYDKYSTMSINQLISALNNAEKKQAKIKEKLKQELSEVKELISYLKSQIKSSLNKPRFYNTNTPKKQTTQIKIPENTEKNENEIEVYEIDKKNIIETLKYISKRKDKLSEIALSDFTRKYKKLTKIPISNEDFRNIFKDYLLFERKDRIKALKDKAIQILNNEIEVYEIDKKNIIETLKYISKRKDKLSEIALSDFTKKYKKLTKIPISNEDFRNIFKDYLLFERKNRIKALKDKAIQILNNEKSNTKEQQNENKSFG